MKNIHLIPTEKTSRLFKDDFDKYFISINIDQEQNHFKPQNIFITSDEEIKEGDWVLLPNESIEKMSHLDIIDYLDSESFATKKIILTTDQDLIKDGVQAIDDTFLEWFVNNPTCEEVEIEKECIYQGKCKKERCLNHSCDEKQYKIIIPQGEHKQLPKSEIDWSGFPKSTKDKVGYVEPKQETLEEFIFKVPFDYNIKSKEVIDMCMKEQENIILTWRLGNFIDMINSLPDDTEKNRILKSVFNNREGELLLESYKSMKLHYEK